MSLSYNFTALSDIKRLTVRNSLPVFIHQLQLPASTGDGTRCIHQCDQGLRIILLQQILTGINNRNIINHFIRHGDLNCAFPPDIQRTCSRGFNTVAGNGIARHNGTKNQRSAIEPKTANLLNTGANRCDIPGFRHQHCMG